MNPEKDEDKGTPIPLTTPDEELGEAAHPDLRQAREDLELQQILAYTDLVHEIGYVQEETVTVKYHEQELAEQKESIARIMEQELQEIINEINKLNIENQQLKTQMGKTSRLNDKTWRYRKYGQKRDIRYSSFDFRLTKNNHVKNHEIEFLEQLYDEVTTKSKDDIQAIVLDFIVERILVLQLSGNKGIAIEVNGSKKLETWIRDIKTKEETAEKMIQKANNANAPRPRQFFEAVEIPIRQQAQEN